uniref:Uncharacterized protein n=1 Tax=Cacopsylla melanoneura TaxID=428564 RepID=A0A8D9EAX1_9HEMI
MKFRNSRMEIIVRSIAGFQVSFFLDLILPETLCTISITYYNYFAQRVSDRYIQYLPARRPDLTSCLSLSDFRLDVYLYIVHFVFELYLYLPIYHIFIYIHYII